ncbi:probable inactive ATP-dependent zinc metalloprotease FTSHI 3, chloroplastic [Amborella trichopoda]|uniref:probable inactive ATP-dependent zinc metalloprotease FTSHI 3, chloroplastic n=1 Tax=Amborella trichopoda TaxID=13333 RepID=UPI0009BF2352|nr:probable inactive ATP-dependent zinc metalloprotease FTSHI 3, chloroplastic [Amborella trichopoda]|eukprot:XP_020522624.1 probable inactive ATP-dependent zinc metalloprotease FTSHI 3, chloroplastic [Amborella trichopoda]
MGDGESENLDESKVRKKPKWQYSTCLVAHDVDYLLSLIREKGVACSLVQPLNFEPVINHWAFRTCLTILFYILVFWIPGKLKVRTGGRGKRASETTRSHNVEGADAAKTELMEIISWRCQLR